jgi:hypothetical protein
MSVIATHWKAALTVIAIGLLVVLGALAIAVGHASRADAAPGIHTRAVTPSPRGDSISNETGDFPQLD